MRQLSLAFILFLGCFAASIGAQDASGESTIRYARDIAPILQRNCIACHREKQAEGGLSMETAKAMLLGGDSGSLLVANQPEESLLYLRATDEDDPMPPEDNSVGASRLTDDELALLKRWILQGAEIDEQTLGVGIDWQPIPESIRSSFAIAVSPDQRIVAIGRANRVDLIDATSGQVIDSLSDDRLQQSGVADVDVIQSIAFSPLGDRIATGGFRSVRLWEREPVSTPVPAALESAVGLIAVDPDRTSVAIVNPLGDVEVWDLDSQRQRFVIASEGPIADIDWQHPMTLLIGDESGDLRVCSADDGTTIAQIKLDHTINQISQSPDGRFAVSLGTDGNLRVFENQQPKTLQSLSGIQDANTVRFLAPSTLAVGTRGGLAVLIDPDGDQITARLDHGSPITTLTANQSATIVATGGIEGKVKLWNGQDGKLLHTLVGDSNSQLRIALLQQDVQREESRLQTLGQKTEALKKRVETEETPLAKVKEAREKALKEFNEKAKQRDDVLGQIKATEVKIADTNAQMEQANQAVTQTGALIAAKAAQMQKLTAELQPLEKQSEIAMSELQSAKAKAEEAMRLLESAQKASADIANRVDETKSQLDSLKKSRAEAAEKLAASKATVAEASQKVEAESATLAKQRESLTTTEKEVESKQMELAERDRALVTAQKTRDRAAGNLPEHQDRIRARTNLLGDLKQRLTVITDHQSAPISISAAAFAVDDSIVAIVDVRGVVRTFDAETGEPLDRFRTTQWPASDARSQAVFLGQRRLLISRRAVLPQVITARKQWTLRRTIGGLESDLISDRVTALDFRGDGQSLAIGSGTPSRNGQLLVVATSSGAVLRRFDDVHSDTVLCVRFSPDDQRLASASADKTIRLLNLQSGELVGSLDGHTHHVLAVAWKHDGRLIASGSADKTIKTWDVETGQRQRTIGGFPDEVTSLAFIGDSTRVVSSCADGHVRVHETSNGGQVHAASVPGDFLFSSAVSRDGSRVYASGQKGDVNVWESEGLKNVGAW